MHHTEEAHHTKGLIIPRWLIITRGLIIPTGLITTGGCIIPMVFSMPRGSSYQSIIPGGAHHTKGHIILRIVIPSGLIVPKVLIILRGLIMGLIIPVGFIIFRMSTKKYPPGATALPSLLGCTGYPRVPPWTLVGALSGTPRVNQL